MKSNKGIALVSLIIYVIVMLIVVTIIGTITSFFYANVNNEYTQNKDDYKNANLEMYLVNDLKNKKIFVTDINCKEEFINGDNTPKNMSSIKLIYENLTQVTYSIKNDGIYRNMIKIYDKQQTDIMYFEVIDVPINSERIIQDKKEIKIIKENPVRTEFKSYIINLLKPKFPITTTTPTPTVTP